MSTEKASSARDSALPNAIRAAEYVRMSTEHQKYSTENQSDAIENYAVQHGMTIVRAYVDQGKSGLRITGRPALQQLIQDVQQHADFTEILVYDVSRWGRFQDADESAYYEYICKEAGLTVHYCAEQFQNDGSLAATIIKGMKRAMAGEYSRELSVKVFTGQCRLIELGYRQGGNAGYGLRRVLVDEAGIEKTSLVRGEHKSIQTDRVILVPGPPQELATIARMYRMFVEGRSEAEIAVILNDEGLATDLGRSWSRGTVHGVLTNEKYIGNNVYNKTSFKLKQRRVKNPPNTWVRCDGAFGSVVDRELFQAAQNRIVLRAKSFTDGELLDRLKRLYASKGWLSGLMIDESLEVPLSSTYRRRFGSLLRAYQLIGYTPHRDYKYIELNRLLRVMHASTVESTIAGIRARGGSVDVDPMTDLLTVNNEFRASLVIARCVQTATGALRWRIRFDTTLRPDITVVIRLRPCNKKIEDYYVIPRRHIELHQVRLKEENGFYIDAYRFDSLEGFFLLAGRSTIRRAA